MLKAIEYCWKQRKGETMRKLLPKHPIVFVDSLIVIAIALGHMLLYHTDTVLCLSIVAFGAVVMVLAWLLRPWGEREA